MVNTVQPPTNRGKIGDDMMNGDSGDMFFLCGQCGGHQFWAIKNGEHVGISGKYLGIWWLNVIHHWSWGIPVRTKRKSHGKVMIFTTDLCLFSSFFMCPFPVSSSIWGYLPSGKHTKNIKKRWEITMFNGKTHYKWPCWKITMLLMGKSTISMAMFNSFLYVHQRVVYQ